MNKVIFISAVTAATLFAGTMTHVSAYESPCQQVYGGGVNCPPGNLLINKTVLNPQTSQFVDNLGVNDAHYAAGQTVTFHIQVTNNGGSRISPVTVRDIFPQYISFVSGPGKFDANTKTLTLSIDGLNAGESKTIEVKGKVTDSNTLPNQSVTCVINTASATIDDKTSTDNAQFCIGTQAMTKGGLPIYAAPVLTTTPPTGPEALAFLGLIPTGLAGLLLKKKTL